MSGPGKPGGVRYAGNATHDRLWYSARQRLVVLTFPTVKEAEQWDAEQETEAEAS